MRGTPKRSGTCLGIFSHCYTRYQKARTTSTTTSNDEKNENVLASRLAALRTAPSYLRHAPPTAYYTCAEEPFLGLGTEKQKEGAALHPASTTTEASPSPRLTRHRMLLLDEVAWRRQGSDDGVGLPHTGGVYLLSSTHETDYSFGNASGGMVSALIGLPRATRGDGDEVRRFLDTHAALLGNVQLLCLPEVVPETGCVVAELRRAFPRVRVVCSEFAKEFLVNGTFYERMQQAVWSGGRRFNNSNNKKNEGDEPHADSSTSLSQYRDWLSRFETLDAENVFAVPSSGAGVTCAFPYADASEPAFFTTADTQPQRTVFRPLQAIAVREEENGVEKKKVRPTAPAFTQHRQIIFYDHAFHSVFVGRAIHRVPWLRHLDLPRTHPDTGKVLADAGLPVPSLAAARYGPPSRGYNDSVIHYWQVKEQTLSLVKAIQKFPLPSAAQDEAESMPMRYITPQRVLSACFGEMPGGVEEVILQMEEACEGLLRLQGRLHRFLAARKGLARGASLDPALVRKVVSRLLTGEVGARLSETAAAGNNTKGGEKGCEQKQREEHEERLLKSLLDWCVPCTGDDLNRNNNNESLIHHHDNVWLHIAQCLLLSARDLPAPQMEEAEEEEGKKTVGGKNVADVPKKLEELPNEMSGEAGVALLQQILHLKGLGGLQTVVKREEIDIAVFLAMTREELQSVFKATFGLLKKLEAVQTEVHAKAFQVSTSLTDSEDDGGQTSSSKTKKMRSNTSSARNITSV